MPLVRISYPHGAMPLAQKKQLAAALTEIALDAEVDAVTESGRMVTVVQFAEAADEDWAIGGTLRSELTDPPRHFVVDVCVLDGLLEGARRGALHRKVTEAFQRAFPTDPMLPLRVWVLIHEIREGSWGAAGRTMAALDVAQFLNPKLDPDLRARIVQELASRRPGPSDDA